MALLPLAATHTAAARTLPDGHFLTLLPGGAATKAGVIFGDKWPKIKAVENASWADEMTALSAGCQLLAINSQPVIHVNFADAKRMLQAAAEACTATLSRPAAVVRSQPPPAADAVAAAAGGAIPAGQPTGRAQPATGKRRPRR